MFSFLLGAIRLVLFILYVSFFSFSFYLASFFWSKEKTVQRAQSLRDFILKITIRILGIRSVVYGTLPTVQGLIISNHRSYLDPIVIVSQIHAYPVGKKEVASWPLIGYLCKISGVIFVERECQNVGKEHVTLLRKRSMKGIQSLIFRRAQHMFCPKQ